MCDCYFAGALGYRLRATDYGLRMQKKLQWLIGSRLLIAVILLIVVGVIERSNSSRPFFPALASLFMGVCVLSVLYFWALKRNFSLVVQAYVQLSVDLGIVTWLVYSTGDVESPFLALYLVIVFAASTLFGRSGVAYIGVSGAILYAAVGFLVMSGLASRAAGWLPYSPSGLKWSQFMFALNLLAILAVSALSGQLAERARVNESQLAKATKDLAENRLFNDRIIESVRSGLITTDLQGEIITFNRAAEEITGYKATEVCGSNVYTIFGNIEKQIEAGLESLRNGSRLPQLNMNCRKANGETIDLGFSVAPLVDENDLANGYVFTFQDLTEKMKLERELRHQERRSDRIIDSLRSGMVTTNLRQEIETFNRAAEEITGYKAAAVCGKNIQTIFGNIEKQIAEGLASVRSNLHPPQFDIDCRNAEGKLIYLGFSVAPLVDDNDEIEGYILNFQDLAEKMQMERQIRQQDRLAALGNMAAGLAHEIRNPLASMRGSVQMLGSELRLSPDQHQLMNIVLRESERLNRIVSDFLTYARPPKTEFAGIELAGILAETITLLRNSPELRSDHTIIEDYPPEPIHYHGDQNQLKQIFWNLSRNAMQAMAEGGMLKVSLTAKPSRDVTITFGDSGTGMTEEQVERLFEPFNSSSGGTGLGMAIVYQLVRDHKGKLLVDSELGIGTRITIRLPAAGRVINETSDLTTARLLPEKSSASSPGVVASTLR